MSEEKADYDVELKCPRCQSTDLRLNGFCHNTGRQVVTCKSCGVNTSYDLDYPLLKAFRAKQAANPERALNGQYVKGQYKGGPGRPVGYKLRLISAVYKALFEEFEENGKAAIARAFVKDDDTKSIALLKSLITLLPKNVELSAEEGTTVSLNAIVIPAKDNDPALAADSQAE